MTDEEREPTHPGVCFREDVLEDDINPFRLSSVMDVPQYELMNILYGVSPVTVDIARKLAAYSETSPLSWYNMQVKLDHYTLNKEDEQ